MRTQNAGQNMPLQCFFLKLKKEENAKKLRQNFAEQNFFQFAPDTKRCEKIAFLSEHKEGDKKTLQYPHQGINL